MKKNLIITMMENDISFIGVSSVFEALGIEDEACLRFLEENAPCFFKEEDLKSKNQSTAVVFCLGASLLDQLNHFGFGGQGFFKTKTWNDPEVKDLLAEKNATGYYLINNVKGDEALKAYYQVMHPALVCEVVMYHKLVLKRRLFESSYAVYDLGESNIKIGFNNENGLTVGRDKMVRGRDFYLLTK